LDHRLRQPGDSLGRLGLLSDRQSAQDAGSPAEAAQAYRRALELAENAAERSFLSRRLAEVEATLF